MSACAVATLHAGLEALFCVLCPDCSDSSNAAHASVGSGDAGMAPSAYGARAGMWNELQARIVAKHLRGKHVEVRADVGEMLQLRLQPLLQAWLAASRHPALPPNVSICVVHLMVLLGFEPLAQQRSALPRGGWGTVVGGRGGIAGGGTWEGVVQEWDLLGAACMVLSQRSAGVMSQAHGRKCMPAIDMRCAQLLVQSPTLPAAAPVWGHVNVCRTCSARLLRCLVETWQEDEEAEGERGCAAEKDGQMHNMRGGRVRGRDLKCGGTGVRGHPPLLRLVILSSHKLVIAKAKAKRYAARRAPAARRGLVPAVNRPCTECRTPTNWGLHESLFVGSNAI